MPETENPESRAQLDNARWGEWMESALEGDAKAYECLMAELGDTLEAWMRVRFGAAQVVEDYVQECLLAVHRARGSWDPRRPFRPWFFTVVRHKTVDLLRRGNVRSREAARSRWIEEAGAARPMDPLAALEGARLLEQLAPNYRDALVLTKLSGYSLAEAANHCGVSQTAMKSRVHRAIREVRSLLASDGAAE